MKKLTNPKSKEAEVELDSVRLLPCLGERDAGEEVLLDLGPRLHARKLTLGECTRGVPLLPGPEH